MVFGRKHNVSNFLGPMDRVRDTQRPSTAQGIPNTMIPGQERRKTRPNMASSFSSHPIGRPLHINDMRVNVPYETRARSQTIQGALANVETVVRRDGPDRKASVKRGVLCALPTPRRGVIGTTESARLHTASNFPHSLEDLYVHCGIVSRDAWKRCMWMEVNNLLEMWALDNPVSALHVMELARKWGLRPEFAKTVRLNESSLWKKTRPGIRENELEKAFEAADEYVDVEYEKLHRGDSRHVTQKQALRRQVREFAYEETKGEIFKSSDLVLPIERPDPVKPLPTAVVELYQMVTGLQIRDLPPMERKVVVDDWSERWPVYDHHLEHVIGNYSVPSPKVNLDPGYVRLCEQVGVSIVERRARTLSNVSVDGRERKGVDTQGSPSGKTLHVMN